MTCTKMLGAIDLGNSARSLKTLHVLAKKALPTTGKYHLLFLGLLECAI